MYENSGTTPELFYETALILIKKNVLQLMQINSKAKNGKLPLPDLKLKHEISSNILDALRLLLENIDYDNKDGATLGTALNDIGILLGQANIEFSLNKYNQILKLIGEFTNVKRNH